jgi:hypothetical protein
MKAKIEKLMVFLIPTDQVVGDFSQSMIKSDKLLETPLRAELQAVEADVLPDDVSKDAPQKETERQCRPQWYR